MAMNMNNRDGAPVHRFTSSNNINFRFVTITGESFAVPDVEHSHNYWTVFVFLEGQGSHVIDFKQVPVTPGKVHVVLPGQIHALHGNANFLAYALIFTEDFFLLREETTRLLMRLFRFVDAGEAVSFDILEDDRVFIASLLGLMKEEYSSQSSSKEGNLLNLLSVFISKCAASILLPQLPGTGDENIGYLQWRTTVENNYREIHTVAEYAERLNCSTRQLNELCRKYADSTALEFIHARLMVEAKRLLKFSAKSVKEIAFDLHFTDTAHFTNFFKQKAGVTPVQFKTEQ